MARKFSEQQIFDLLMESDIEDMSDDEQNEEEFNCLAVEEEIVEELMEEEKSQTPEVLPQVQVKRLKWLSKNISNSSQCSDKEDWEVGNRQLWTPFDYFL